jgi:hypothetical protein
MAKKTGSSTLTQKKAKLAPAPNIRFPNAYFKVNHAGAEFPNIG